MAYFLCNVFICDSVPACCHVFQGSASSAQCAIRIACPVDHVGAIAYWQQAPVADDGILNVCRRVCLVLLFTWLVKPHTRHIVIGKAEQYSLCYQNKGQQRYITFCLWIFSLIKTRRGKLDKHCVSGESPETLHWVPVGYANGKRRIIFSNVKQMYLHPDVLLQNNTTNSEQEKRPTIRNSLQGKSIWTYLNCKRK